MSRIQDKVSRGRGRLPAHRGAAGEGGAVPVVESWRVRLAAGDIEAGSGEWVVVLRLSRGKPDWRMSGLVTLIV
jgi:hypothetical protein